MKSLSAASATVFVLPAAASSGEDIASKVDRLTQELSEALSEYLNGQFRAIVEPSSAPHCQVYLQNMHVGPGRGADPELVELIEAHGVAWHKFEDVCPLNDDSSPYYDAENGQALWDWHCDAEEEARQALLAHPALSMADIRLKVGYLFKMRGSDYLIEGADDLELLLLSLVRGNDDKLNKAIERIDDMRATGFVFECHGDRADPNSYHIFKDAENRWDQSSSLIAAVVAKAIPTSGAKAQVIT